MGRMVLNVGLLTTGLALGIGVSSLRSATPVASEQAPATAERRPSSPAPVTAALRAAVVAAVERAEDVPLEDVGAALDTLEAQARTRGQVTALDVEPGLALLRRAGDNDAARMFSERMLRVQAELAAATSPPADEPPPPVVDAEELLIRIERSAGQERQALIHTLLAQLPQLPEEVQGALALRLNASAGRVDEPYDEATLDSLWEAMRDAGDEVSRGVLVNEYLELVHTLPDDERITRLAALQRTFGAQATAP